MRILIVGGNGSVGRELIPALLAGGHQIVVLDIELGAVRAIAHPQLVLVSGAVEDEAAVAQATRGAEAVIHLAWSFSDDPTYLLEHDLRGHLLLLAAAHEQGTRRFIYTSTAVVYGKPLRTPIDEDHPLRVLEARKPAYGMAKEFAEKLTLLAAQGSDLSATVVRFWWAFGREIGGKHLREMLRTAAEGKTLRVPADCGGSFLSQDDFNLAVATILSRPESGGRVFNLASAYVSWDEIARLVVEVTGSASKVESIPATEWRGAAFLADRWELDNRRVRSHLGLTLSSDPRGVREGLRQAIRKTWEAIRSKA